MAYILALLCVTLLSLNLVTSRRKYVEKSAWAVCVLLSSTMLLIYAADVKTAKLYFSASPFVTRFCDLPVIVSFILLALMTAFIGYIVIKERSKTKFFPDENGILYIYQVGISGKTIRSVPDKWNYLGKFELSPPFDEYIPFDKSSIWGFIWDYRRDFGRKAFFDKYLRYNCENKDYVESVKKMRERWQIAMKKIITYFEKNQEDIDKIMELITTIK